MPPRINAAYHINALMHRLLLTYPLINRRLHSEDNPGYCLHLILPMLPMRLINKITRHALGAQIYHNT